MQRQEARLPPTQVTEQAGSTLHFDVIDETLRVTNLGLLEAGSAVNYERSARMGDEIGGHAVSGHVHTTATVVEVASSPDNCRIRLQVSDAAWMKYILPKGFIALDGCSLTVGEVQGDTLDIYLIPETLRVTLFGRASLGQKVNLEVDAQTQAVVDTVERFLGQQQQQQQQQQQRQPSKKAGFESTGVIWLCAEAGCRVRATHGTPGGAPEWCSRHRPDGAVLLSGSVVESKTRSISREAAADAAANWEGWDESAYRNILSDVVSTEYVSTEVKTTVGHGLKLVETERPQEPKPWWPTW